MPKQYKYSKYFTFDGKRYVVRGNSEAEVIAAKALKLRDLEEGRVTISRSMLLKEWVPLCIDTYKTNISDKNKKDMMYRLNKHIVSEIGAMRLKDIRPLQLQAVLNAQSGMSKSHVTKLYQELNFIFERAVDNRLLLDNPAKNLTMPSTYAGTRRSITEYEREHLLKVSEDEPRFTLFLLMLYCGCRPSEAIGAIGRDIQERDGAHLLHIRGTKTANSDRIVPIPRVFYERIGNTAPFDPIAPNGAGNIHTESSYNRLVAFLRRQLNISMGCKVYRNEILPPFPLAEDFVPYDLRHTYCTDLAKRGVDVRTAQKLMGHSSINITANIYTHVDETQVLVAAKLLDAI